MGAGLFLRFWTRSNMWLDEAQTLNIATLPLSHIHAALRQDGAPPLYYVLLHAWTSVFGTSDLAARSLPGVFGVAAVPLAWRAGDRLGGPRCAWAVTLLLLSSPFAVRYSTENRMYSLVMVEVFAGWILLERLRDRPTWRDGVGLAATAAALVYTHYWSFFLLGAVLLGLGGAAWKGRRPRESMIAAAAIAAGIATFAPWGPTFLYQLHHTGTPWAQPASFSAMVDAVSQFAGGSTSVGRGLGLTFFALAALGLFGQARGGRNIDLDLRTRPRARMPAFVAVVTLALAIAVGYGTGSGFQARYAAVVFPVFLLVAGYGTLAFGSDAVRRSVLAVAVVLGLAGCASNVTTDRTQATHVAAAIRAGAAPGDVVAYCPDQLGPDTSRLLPGTLGLRQIAFPRSSSPRIVDWVDYASTVAGSDPQAFSTRVERLAGPHQAIWLVWMSEYLGLRTDCQQIATDIAQARPHVRALVTPNPKKYFEPSVLYQYPPAP